MQELIIHRVHIAICMYSVRKMTPHNNNPCILNNNNPILEYSVVAIVLQLLHHLIPHAITSDIAIASLASVTDTPIHVHY